ncbi:MAG: 50S ribosomal protein L11 methyltransferase [Pseudomonadota bacterium]
MSDAVRTEAFRQAITQAVKPGDVVADVGCGVAVLGLMCLEAGAARVWGIDCTDAIEIARETAQRAGFADRYHCVGESSFRAVLPEPVDVVICDHVGYFGIDYGIIQIATDARRRFLRPGGRVIPGRITLQVAGVTSPDCRAKAEAWAGPDVPAAFHWLRDSGINIKYSQLLDRETVITGQSALGTIDLNAEIPDAVRFDAELVAVSAGQLDGLGGWFDCEIVEGVTMTNSPLADRPIRRPQVFLAFDRPLTVDEGDRISVSVSIRPDAAVIAWSGRNCRTGEAFRQSTWRSQILREEDFAPKGTQIRSLTPVGAALQAILGYVDGRRTDREIEDLVLHNHPGLLPSDEEVRKLVRSELARSAR